MTPERHKQVNEICHAMLQLPSSQRLAYLGQACGQDEALRREIESLLDYEEQAATFIETPALEVLARDLAQAQSLTGQRISHFHLLAPLGKGGMGEVYRARDQRLGRQVAIKLLLPEFTANKTFVERFDQEARAASALNHPNILTVYEIDEVQGLHFIVAELVEGQTLRQVINNQPVDLPRALTIATQIASALQSAHEAGITHRDIKPENIMVRPDGLVKVLDFGLAKLTGRDEGGGRREESAKSIPFHASAFRPHPATNPGAVMGTVSYMSPEQARGQVVDHRSDLFSLGVVLYEMLTGHLPFTGSTPLEVLDCIVQQPPAPLPASVPDGVARIIATALQKAREERYQSAQEFWIDLTHSKEALNSAATAPPTILLPPAKRLGTRRALVAGLLLVFAVVSFLLWRASRTPRPEIKSLAVLPLKTLTHEAGDPSLGLGIADTIITKVSQIGGLVVRPTSAVRRYASSDADALQAAREQRVEAVLDGTIQRAGDRLRVNVNLLRTQDGASLWAEQFDLGFTEIFGLQDKVARQVAEHLQYRLSAAEQVRIAKQHTTNSLAYEYYVKATYYFGDRKMFWWQRELTDKSVELLQQAVALDPNYALARVMLAYGYAHTAIMHEENPELIRRATLELAQAEKLDPQLAEIHVVRSFILFSRYNNYPFEATLAELRQAQRLDPNAGHFELAFVYAHWGVAQWKEELEQALALEPASEVIKDHIIRFHFIENPEAALAAMKRFGLREQDPAYPLYMAFYYSAKRMPQEAAPYIAAATRNNPDWYNFRGLALALEGKFREAEATLDAWEKTKMPPVFHPVYHHFTHIAARIYALEGKSDEAVKWLRVTAQEGFPSYPAFLNDRYLDSIRNDPPFQQLMAEMKTRWENYQRVVSR